VSAGKQDWAGQPPRKRGNSANVAEAPRNRVHPNRIRAQVFAEGMMPHIKALQRQGLSLREMVHELNSQGVPAARGGRWHITTLRKVLSRVLVASLAQPRLA
jgi:Recombinase